MPLSIPYIKFLKKYIYLQSKNKAILEKVKALKEKSIEIKEEMSTKAGIQKQFMEELQKADTTLSRFVSVFQF